MNKLNNINSKQDHILACLSSAPSNAKIIRTAARMAKAFDSQFTALFVETPDFAVATDENKKRLEENRKLAEQLGATIETVYGDDVPYQIAEFARISGITRIVLGQSSAIQKHLFGKPTLTQLLLSYVPELDIHIIPDKSSQKGEEIPSRANHKKHCKERSDSVCGNITQFVVSRDRLYRCKYYNGVYSWCVVDIYCHIPSDIQLDFIHSQCIYL